MPAFFLKFSNTVRALRVNETKLDSGTTLLVDLSALVGEKDQNVTKELYFGAPRRVVTILSLGTLFPKHSCMRFSIRL